MGPGYSYHGGSGGSYHGGGHGGHGGGYTHGGGYHHGGGHYYGSSSVYIGPVWYPWYYPYPYPYPYPYYYSPPPVVIETGPQEYIYQSPQPAAPSYWYHCGNPEGYYPYVKQCPGGWEKVAPTNPQD